MNGQPLYVTTSWDDGHPLDLRLAEMLSKYAIPATFYIPLKNDRDLVGSSEIRALGAQFEIGGHTVTHCDMRSLSADAGLEEILGCKQVIEQITGRACRSFCFPMGRYRTRHLDEVWNAGFRVARTVEIMSLDGPRMHHDLYVLPTTMQVLPIRLASIFRNSARRMKLSNLICFLQVRRTSLLATAEALLLKGLERGGVFHLWGHSWEIEENGDWESLDSILELLSRYRDRVHFVTNEELGNITWSGGGQKSPSEQG